MNERKFFAVGAVDFSNGFARVGKALLLSEKKVPEVPLNNGKKKKQIVKVS